jgi:hypothetical protein
MLGFRPNQSEHPETNYRHIPINGLYHLRRAVAEMNEKLAHIDVPVLIMQADNDQVVDPASANMIARRLTGTQNKTVKMLPSDRHGILNEDIAGAVDLVMEFVAKADQAELPISSPPLEITNVHDNKTAQIAPPEAVIAAIPVISAREKSRSILARAGFGKSATANTKEPAQTVPTDPAELPTTLTPAQPE